MTLSESSPQIDLLLLLAYAFAQLAVLGGDLWGQLGPGVGLGRGHGDILAGLKLADWSRFPGGSDQALDTADAYAIPSCQDLLWSAIEEGRDAPSMPVAGFLACCCHSQTSDHP
ncbi:hypothetical protein L0U85_18710 [Glycomyces sp. L485]|uniref:hypothetical protein n=1 Tax=Glycomyces sp. L485 TaxID=2909235 RepID=UPI001F4B1D46|nr:hypothetical protein [Glycomyces sp. L485]MCH7232869.1 hypothetical protein [Glycomyces sp. L485]